MSIHEFLTVEEAADLLRVNRNSVYEAIKRSDFPGILRIGRLIRIRRSALVSGVASSDPTVTEPLKATE